MRVAVNMQYPCPEVEGAGQQKGQVGLNCIWYRRPFWTPYVFGDDGLCADYREQAAP